MPRQQTYRDLAAWLRTRESRLGATRLVTVDGPAGSGKTTFAQRLGAALGHLAVVHLDDLYEGWSGLNDELWHRLDDGVLLPVTAGRPGRYRRYDWAAGEFAEWVDVPPADVLIVEGVGSGQRGVDGRATLRVWVEAPEPMRLRRGLERDGAEMRSEWLRWLRSEAEHFARHDTPARADLVVDGATGDAATYAVRADRRATAADPAD